MRDDRDSGSVQGNDQNVELTPKEKTRLEIKKTIAEMFMKFKPQLLCMEVHAADVAKVIANDILKKAEEILRDMHTPRQVKFEMPLWKTLNAASAGLTQTGVVSQAGLENRVTEELQNIFADTRESIRFEANYTGMVFVVTLFHGMPEEND